MELKDKKVIVTGGSRGLGLGLVEALVAHGAQVTVVARSSKDLKPLTKRLGVRTVEADITDRAKAKKIIASILPDVLILNAGVAPHMGPIDTLSWDAFSKAWEVDVKGGLFWIQSALTTPLPQNSRVLVVSSGGAVAGSAMTGGYAGAKRMLWFMADYANALANDRGLGIRFQTVIPRQQVAGTGIGDAASSAYSAKLGITQAEYLTRFGAPMEPRDFGEHVVRILTDPTLDDARAFNVKGDTGLTIYEESAP